MSRTTLKLNYLDTVELFNTSEEKRNLERNTETRFCPVSYTRSLTGRGTKLPLSNDPQWGFSSGEIIYKDTKVRVTLDTETEPFP